MPSCVIIDLESACMMNLDFDPEEFRVKIRVKDGKHSINDKVKMKITEEEFVPEFVTIHCASCGKDFVPRSNRQKYCSKECGLALNPKYGNPSDESIDRVLAEVKRKRARRDAVPYEFGK